MQPIEHTVAGLSYTEYSIPKKNGKVRRIFAPSPELLAKQQSDLPVLNSTFVVKEHKYGIPNILHGFIPGRSCITAAKQHIGYEHTIMMDISAFFDNVTPSHLDIVSFPHHFHTDSDGKQFTAQGFATSPILANLAILPIVKQVDTYLTGLLGCEYAFTVYADDVQISFNGIDFIEISQRIEQMVTILFNLQGFSMNATKTRIRHAKFGYRRILGVNVGDNHIRASRKTMRKLRCARHQAKWPSTGGLTNWRNQCTQQIFPS